MRRLSSTLVLLLALSACGGGGDTGATPTTPPTSAAPSPTSDEPQVTLDEVVALPDSGFELYIRCSGEGSPTTVLEAGSADEGTQAFSEFFVQPIATVGTVCTYDRVGMGRSSTPEQDVRRTLRDQVNELHELLTVTDLPTPYVLVGSSWGGFVVMDYAAVYPDDVGALVLLDVPAPNANLTEEDLGGSWDEAPNNPERTDALEAEHRLANEPPQIPPVHLRVVTASDGQSSVEDQSFWMELSPESVSVLLEGEHDIYLSDPAGSQAEILEAIAAAG